MAKKEFEYEYDPIKVAKDGKEAERVVWSTYSLNLAVDGIKKGLPLKANPFIGKNTKLLKPNLVYKRTREEVEDYIRCKQDPVYFAEKCFLMTPEGLQKCKMRDYQVDYLHHLQKNRFSIFLSCRQSGKSLSLLTNINIKSVNKLEKLNHYYVNDNVYCLPIFELYNLYCKQTILWKIKYRAYKMIYKFENGRKIRNEGDKEK